MPWSRTAQTAQLVPDCVDRAGHTGELRWTCARRWTWPIQLSSVDQALVPRREAGDPLADG